MELYENSYNKKKHFSFGKNWQNFLKSLNSEKIENAKKSLVDFLGGEEKIKDKSFIDIGCGSGLFSLAAFKLGASEIISVDIDEFSISCTNHLKEKENNPSNWKITRGSALNENFLKSLGQFDIVYSWGVLHHSGNMYRSFENILFLMKPLGIFYLAIYNNNKNKWKEGTSNFWYKIKKIYNNSGIFTKKIILYFYTAYFILGLIANGKNPVSYIKNYKSNRGMNWYTDIIDWLGGYPYEYATPDEIINFFGKRNILCKRLLYRDNIGCSEYLFIKNI